VKPLDKLYAKGTTAAFGKACGDSPTVKQVEIEDGVRLYVEWKNGSTAKLDCSATQVNWLHLASSGKGLYQRMVDLAPFFRERGVKLWLASAADEQAESILLGKGEWQKVGSHLEWGL
jgi:hypothetical protein